MLMQQGMLQIIGAYVCVQVSRVCLQLCYEQIYLECRGLFRTQSSIYTEAFLRK